MKRLIFSILFGTICSGNMIWASSLENDVHEIHPYVGLKGTEIGMVLPMIGIRSQCEKTILDFSISYGLARNCISNWHCVNINGSALTSFYKNKIGESYAGLGVEFAAIIRDSNFRENYRSLFPQFIVGVQRKSSESPFIFFEVSISPWEIPLHKHVTGRKDGSILFKTGISF